jgi:DNA-binding response OmpR family regulator
MKHLVFVVDDDAEVARLMCDALQRFHYETEQFGLGRDLLRRVARRTPSLCLVDLGLPDVDGLDVLRELQDAGLAAIVVTGRGDVADRVLGLELGADDYIVKPFDPRELVARVATVLRRLERGSPEGSNTVARFAGWTFDVDAHCLAAPDGRTIALSRAETRLLEIFARAGHRVLSREFLLDAVGAPPAFDRTIDVRVSRLRRKLEPDPQHPDLIRTVYGSGYLFASTVVWTRGR